MNFKNLFESFSKVLNYALIGLMDAIELEILLLQKYILLNIYDLKISVAVWISMFLS